MKWSKVSEIAKEGSETIASGDSKTQDGKQWNIKDGNEVNKVTRPGRYSMMNNKPEKSTGRPATKLCCTGCENQAHPLGGLCLARGKYCLRCGKSNHFTRMRPSRKPNQTRSRGGLDPSKSHPGSRCLVQSNLESHKILLCYKSKYYPCNIGTCKQTLQSLLRGNLRVLKEQAASGQQKWLSEVTQEMVWASTAIS